MRFFYATSRKRLRQNIVESRMFRMESMSSHSTQTSLNDVGHVSDNSQHTERESYATLIWYTLAALGIALFIRFFVAAPYIVEGASMENTFHTFNYLIIDKLSYEIGSPIRGDVVVMKFPYDTTRSFIKRVIGLPGETVIIDGTSVTIKNAEHPTGFLLEEPYVSPDNFAESHVEITLGPTEYWVLGDNRKASADSRAWGTLPRKDIVGRAFVRLYPLGEATLFPGQARYIDDSSAAATAVN